MISKKGGKENSEGLGISGFTLGILSIVFAGLLGLVISIVGFIFCFFQQKNHPNKLAKAGIILNIIGFILSIILIIISFFILYPMVNQGSFPVS